MSAGRTCFCRFAIRRGWGSADIVEVIFIRTSLYRIGKKCFYNGTIIFTIPLAGVLSLGIQLSSGHYRKFKGKILWQIAIKKYFCSSVHPENKEISSFFRLSMSFLWTSISKTSTVVFSALAINSIVFKLYKIVIDIQTYNFKDVKIWRNRHNGGRRC